MKIYIIIKNGYLRIVNHVNDDMIFQELDVPDNYDPAFVLERAEWLLEMFTHGQEHHEALEQEAHCFSCGRNANNVMIFVMVQR